MPSSDDDLGDRVADVLDRIGLEDLTDDYREVNERGDERLAAAFDPLPDALAAAPEVHEVNKVNTHRDGDDVLVPVVPVLFEAPGDPAMDVVWRTAGAVLEAVHPVFEPFHVRHYDLQFAHADEAEEEVIYRRVTVAPDSVASYLEEPGFGLDDLRRAVREGDDGDDGVPPVNWQRFDARSAASSGAYAGGDAAVVAACTAASTGAAAACAGGAAGAGAGAGAGGC